ncbi:MAG: transglycosylase domain-containing protein [Candidatus Dormibacteria bacterium]
MREFKIERNSRAPVRPGRARRQPASGWRRLVGLAVVAALAATVLMAVPLTALARAYSALPTALPLPTDTVIYGQNDQVVADLHPAGISRIPVPLSQIAPVMQTAVVAIEDHSFWTAPSFDIGRIIQAGIFDVIHHSAAQGASTIPEQVAKLLYLHDNKSVSYKVKEILYGNELAAQMSKPQILDSYLNDVYFGQGATGIQAAAQTYFGVNASQLTAAQATLLAGLLPAPSYLDPYSNMAGARLRQQTVVAAMTKYANLSPAAASKILASPPALASGSEAPVDYAPYFVDQVKLWLQSHYGSGYSTMGLRVYTSLNLALNQKAQQLVTADIARHQAMHMTDGALVAEDPTTGDVVVWVGGAGAQVPGGQIDMAAAPRQPGSTFKLFTYSAAITARKVTMTSPVRDSPLTLPSGGPGGGPFVVHDYEGRYAGVVPIQVALGNSLNVPAVRVELATGIPQVLTMARAMGVTTLTGTSSSYGPSMTLGAYPIPLWELAQAGSVFAAQGILHPAHFVLEVVNQSGSIIYTPKTQAQLVLSRQAAFIMNTILSQNSNRLLAFGSNTPLILPGHTAAIKTGTSNNFVDNLAVGWTPTLVGADWVGNASAAPMHGGGINGISGAASLWNQFMSAALAKTPNSWYPTPSGLITKQVDGQTAYYLPGTGVSYQVLGGGSTAPTPSPSPSASPSPGASPTTSPSPTVTAPSGGPTASISPTPTG